MSTTDSKLAPAFRPRGNHHLALNTESLEFRRLLDATASVASAATFAIGLPIASLEAGAYTPIPVGSTWQVPDQTTEEIVSIELTGSPSGLTSNVGLATPAQTYQSSQAGISLPLFISSPAIPPAPLAMFGPSATGPAATLNPLGYGSETANAAASEVVQPTPGRSDRISSIVRTPPIIPLPHYDSPENEIVTKPELQAKPLAQPPAQPVQPQLEKAEPPAKPVEQVLPAPPIDIVPQPKFELAPVPPKEPITMEAWDDALDLVEADLPEISPAVPTSHAEGSMAVGALLAAWGGWSYRSRIGGQSRRRPLVLEGLQAGPTH